MRMMVSKLYQILLIILMVALDVVDLDEDGDYDLGLQNIIIIYYYGMKMMVQKIYEKDYR